MARNYLTVEGVRRKACPICNGTIVVSWLYQYSHDYKINRNGKLSKRRKITDGGSMEVAIATCEKCNLHWDSDEFEIDEKDRFIDYKYYKEKSAMKITKYRTAAIIYPYLSLECEVKDGDSTVYANICVNDKGKQEEMNQDSYLCYGKPMDMIGRDAEGNEIEYDADYENSIRDIDTDIIRQMYDFWNSNPVFDNDKTWKDWR